MIEFNIPYITGDEQKYISEVIQNKKLSGNGVFARKCTDLLRSRYDFGKCLLTTSCTDALEMCAILLNLQKGDEVILPSYTFVSTANAFVMHGASVVFADSKSDFPNIDETKIEALISPRTRAIVVVHYAGVSCDMDVIMDIANRYNLIVIEDAAQAIDCYYKNRPLGGVGHLATMSFHDTKNILAGECGMLILNDERFFKRADIVLEKGTNRASFFRGEVDKYGWVDIGSSFPSSELINAFLYAQLLHIDEIQSRRVALWDLYHKAIHSFDKKLGIKGMSVPEYARHNGHIYFLICKDLEERSDLISFLKTKDIKATFHYLSLHKSSYFCDKYSGKELANSDVFTDTLVRLPMHLYLSESDVSSVVGAVHDFFAHRY